VTNPAHVLLGQFVDHGADEIIRMSVEPWLGLLAERGVEVRRANGTTIAYQGIRFEGSPRQVFWDSSYIDPFLRGLVDAFVTSAAKTAREQGHDVGVVLDFIAGSLRSNISRVLARMVEIDRRLLGQGYPDTVKPRSVADKESELCQYLEGRLRIEHWTELRYTRSVLFESSAKASTHIDTFSTWLLAGVTAFIAILTANQDKLEWLVPQDRLLGCLVFLIGILLLAIAQKGCATVIAARGAGYQVGRNLIERGEPVSAPSVIVKGVVASSLPPFRSMMRRQLNKLLAGDQLADARSTFRLSQYQSILAAIQLTLVLALMGWLVVSAASSGESRGRNTIVPASTPLGAIEEGQSKGPSVPATGVSPTGTKPH
jgi:hypothetical protein